MFDTLFVFLYNNNINKELGWSNGENFYWKERN